MPSGTTHGLATLGLAACFALSARNGIPPEWLEPSVAEALALGALAGIPLTPDLDLNRSPLARRIFGPLYIFWRAYWFPYARLVNHRSWISHFPIVGTLLRVLYLALPALAVMAALQMATPLRFGAQDGAMLLYLFGGLAASDTLHWLLDTIHTALLPLRRRLRPRRFL